MTARFRHNKKRNTAFLFEVLVKEMAKAVLNKDASRQTTTAQIIKNHFAKGTALYQELSLYRAITETKEIDEHTARRIVLEARRKAASLSAKIIFNEQSDLIRQINIALGSDVYSNFVPNYKNLASISQLFADNTPVKKVVLLEDSLVESMVIKAVQPTATMQPIDNLVYKTFANKFNEQYSGKLSEEQTALLTRFVYSISDNGISLRSYLNEEVDRLRSAVQDSYTSAEIRSDKNMLRRAEQVVDFLDSLHEVKLTEKEVKKILKIQELVREVANNG